MSCTCNKSEETLCQCCAGTARQTPSATVNRPGLRSLRYRVGTYSSFLQSMQAELSSSSVPALAPLRTRESNDLSLALVDAWSEVLDILTFYTERLANETYLGTAVEGRSIFELARLVGYKPSPGVSASTVLAFTLSSAPGSPASTFIAAGTRVQSVPGPRQTPRTFETVADLNATIVGNAIPAATTQPWQLRGADTSTWIAGTANNIRVGDVLLFVITTGGSPVLHGPAAVVHVTAVSIDSTAGNTHISWDKSLPSSFVAGSSEVSLYIFRAKAALYGVGAPSPAIFPADTLKNIPGAPGSPTSDWVYSYNSGGKINLDSVVSGMNPAAVSPSGTADKLQWVLIIDPSYTAYCQVSSATESNPNRYSISTKTTQLSISSVFDLMDGTTDVDVELEYFVGQTRATTVYAQSELLRFADLPLTQLAGFSYPLTQGLLSPIFGASILVTGLRIVANGSPIGVLGKRLRIAPATALANGFTPAGANTGRAVSARQPFLVDAFPPAQDTDGNLLWNVLTVGGQPGILSIPPAQFVLLPSGSSDPVTGESGFVSTAEVQGATTALALSSQLARLYDRSTVTVNTNAVEANDGETTQEILGSGNATDAALQLALKQSPLTYISSAAAGGMRSTLEVWVNNLRWKEVPSFLSSSPADRVFVTQATASTGTVVQFGDGLHGSRTPTGQANIRAVYRKGLGLAGMVSAGQLSQPIDRPQGLQAVTNPSPATGGADPASPDDARISAPLPTLTLGRVVSLEDYQNFALAFAGIEVTTATWSWFGTTRGIFFTVAGEGGAVLQSSDKVIQNLISALMSSGLPNIPLAVVSYVPVLFEVGLQIKVDDAYDSSLVVAQVWQKLLAAFSFGMLRPSEGVAASAVVQVAQSVAGVVAVNLKTLKRSGSDDAFSVVLCAAGPDVSLSAPRGAEILSIDPASQGNLEVWS
ncbi:hypothetical protein [Edaphobacter aggregans]|uniref:hypothetical protein n=1 Tax=Edaphobacter aggregans TaxID=570835 RepID=UPI000691BA84|nr:hypothetical protein [Edaphobacter aggregans]